MKFAFGDCVFDSGTHEVIRRGRVSPLPPKAFALLDLLIARRPNAVSKQEIHSQLWPETFVADTSLANLIADLRTALGDDARKPRIIRTVHRFGYAFRANVEGMAPRAAPQPFPPIVCRIFWEDREILLKTGENVLGREPAAAVWIDDPRVSRRHARIAVGTEGASLEDLGSRNGTRLRGKKIRDVAQLADRDLIQIGPATMMIRIYRQTGSTEPAIEDDPTQ